MRTWQFLLESRRANQTIARPRMEHKLHHKKLTYFIRTAALIGTAMGYMCPAAAEDASVQEAAEQSSGPQTSQTYAPEYFTAFAPRNALDMLDKVPGFSIEEVDSARGLGQASGNVLINGERLTVKSDTVEDQLKRINASDVVQIKIADGATLDVPGLSGKVANVVVRQTGFSGQFNWQPQAGNEAKQALFTKGEISAGASIGAADFTLAFSNNSRYGGSIGPALITAGDGSLIDERMLVTNAHAEKPKVSGTMRLALPGNITANFSASHLWDYFKWRRREERMPVAGGTAVRFLQRNNKAREYEIGADIEFPVGPGKLKLIALESFERKDFSSQSIIEPGDTQLDTGNRYELHSEKGERIARAEYNWPMLGGDWQISTEAAFNRLDNVGSLLSLDANGEFQPLSFPSGTGGVTEDRYETILSYGRPITDKLSLQLALGGGIFEACSDRFQCRGTQLPPSQRLARSRLGSEQWPEHFSAAQPPCRTIRLQRLPCSGVRGQ